MNLPRGIYVSPEDFPHIYADHCRNEGKRFVPSCVQLSEGGPIDLCTLFNCVVSAQGSLSASHRRLWPEIAAKLGFVHVPATNTEPARSNAELARQLERVYDVYLFDFEYMVVNFTAQYMKVTELLGMIPYSPAELRRQKAPPKEVELLERYLLFWHILHDIQEFDARRKACRPRRDWAEERGAHRSPHAGLRYLASDFSGSDVGTSDTSESDDRTEQQPSTSYQSILKPHVVGRILSSTELRQTGAWIDMVWQEYLRDRRHQPVTIPDDEWPVFHALFVQASQELSRVHIATVVCMLREEDAQSLVALALEQRQYVDAGTRQGLFSVQRLTWLRDTWRAWRA
ncbi:uncharacterized protein B0H18DRAFT_958833 [Fomitopsis serialis]|uniref:uncharacterized protein n=1 Tax=Fomitopsis serialis TaxID=139415 RepID=UPI002007E35C|nr:uncharacterized protein B0H18DRAFT_958833 [Neoantrodia serialis]KAH9916483.1 hypothetical protein B0H18DRAFT_958833 [Neoantrodia serialis]